jgi:hypothetical protein
MPLVDGELVVEISALTAVEMKAATSSQHAGFIQKRYAACMKDKGILPLLLAGSRCRLT